MEKVEVDIKSIRLVELLTINVIDQTDEELNEEIELTNELDSILGKEWVDEQYKNYASYE